MENIEVEKGDQMRSPKINVVHSQVSSQNAMSSKSKKRRVAEDDELENKISYSFDNVSVAIDKVIEDMAKCFSKSWSKSSHSFGHTRIVTNFKD